MGELFKPEELSEEEKDKDVDMLQLVAKILPELSVENVQALALVLSKPSSGSQKQQHVHLNAILRRFHAVRYSLQV